MVSGFRIDVINLNELRSWRRSGEVTLLKRLSCKQPVTICELVVNFYVELMILIRLNCVRVEVAASARLIACRRPYRAA